MKVVWILVLEREKEKEKEKEKRGGKCGYQDTA